jgi:hypothetical protein
MARIQAAKPRQPAHRPFDWKFWAFAYLLFLNVTKVHDNEKLIGLAALPGFFSTHSGGFGT